MDFLKPTLSWRSAAWQPASLKTLAENNIWHAVTHGKDGEVEKTLKQWGSKVSEDDKAELVNTFRNFEEDIENIQSQTWDMMDDVQIGAGYSLLSIAICRNLLEDVKFLVQQPGISLNTPSGSERLTPLHMAIIGEHSDLVSEILHNRSTAPSQLVNTRDSDGKTALHHAVMKYCWKEEEFTEESKTRKDVLQLLKHGANIDAQNRSFHTPLHLLIIHGPDREEIEFARLLLENGAEVNTKDEYGEIVNTQYCVILETERSL
ncbi:hypothetical protein GL218_03548 [Daldinia childiae]|uniref:uncharacterized protein n=1 Tax=Daldinia childiae TaxID=326645 RepID=UPI001446FBAF|nr:uncharacterized protein GL218_03548 [Daldinia childiae]KAF3062154.1 hypothetical protein GL218_03548 [Daldinia childiae]